MSFIKSIKEKKPSVEAHKQLLRFGSGEFEREKITLKAGASIECSAGFEYLGLLQDLFIQFCDESMIEAKGIITGKEKSKIGELLKKYGIEPVKVTGSKYNVSFSLEKNKMKELKNELFDNGMYFLVSLNAGKESLKSKTTFPKPGKIVKGYAKLKIDKKNKDAVAEALLIGSFSKKASVNTTYTIKNVLFDEELLKKDPAKARLESKRDLVVKRKVNIDGKEHEESFEALV